MTSNGMANGFDVPRPCESGPLNLSSIVDHFAYDAVPGSCAAPMAETQSQTAALSRIPAD
jgi:hypothetical protein